MGGDGKIYPGNGYPVVTLIFPRLLSRQKPLSVPLSILALGSALKHAGFRVHLLDERTLPDLQSVLSSVIHESLFVGISIRPGNQVKYGLDIARFCKRISPKTPVVAGGWYPSIAPELFARHSAIDMVLSGEADRTVVLLAKSLQESREISNIPGMYCLDGDAIHGTPRTPIQEFNSTPALDYSLIPMEPYLSGDREINYISSRGCPGKCTFCAVASLYPEQWSGLNPSRMIEEIDVLHRHYHVQKIMFVDTDFFADPQRVSDFAKLLLQRKLGIQWAAAGRVHVLHRQSPEWFRLLRESGCYRIETGAESGSAKMLCQYNKEATPDQIIAVASEATRHGIQCTLNWILGAPGEDLSDFLTTYQLAHRMYRSLSKIQYIFYRYTPVPTTEIGDRVLTDHALSPANPDDLPRYRFYVEHPVMPWLTQTSERIIKQCYFFYFPLIFMDSQSGNWFKRRLIGILQRIAQWRLNARFFAVPVGWRIYHALVKLGILEEGRLYAWR